MWTAQFWKDSIERAVKTAAQSLLALVAVFNIADASAAWQDYLIGVGIAVGLSFLTSILSSLSGSSDSASLVK
jgi:Putative lactococcus lactis phage r1t holin